MVDIILSVKVSRASLGLSDLDLNDHVNYYISDQNFLGATVAYDRSQVGSPFVDGQVTVYRHKQMVQDNLTVEVLGLNYNHWLTQTQALVEAFSQDAFNMQIAWGSAVQTYQCEAADYTVNYSKERMQIFRGQVTFAVLRQPVALTGGF